MSGEQLSQQNQ